MFSPLSFLIVVHISAARQCECMWWENGRSGGEVVLCAGISHGKSVVIVQRAFGANYAKEPPTYKTIHIWYKQFTETGCLRMQKSSGHPLTAEELEYCIDVCHVTSGAHIEDL